ncbi:MAG: helix-turn-helix domain-containing protein [Myxococcus sp.]|nr:helix-turn-helix domain-containing protein [Myxococcus sp.]
MSAPFEPGLWRVRDVARFLSMSVSWVYKETEAGRLPCVRIGAALRFSPEQMRGYLANLERGRVLTLPRRPAAGPDPASE